MRERWGGAGGSGLNEVLKENEEGIRNYMPELGDMAICYVQYIIAMYTI